MAALRHFNDHCCPRQPKSYKAIQRKIESQNYGVDNTNYIWNWTVSKSTAHPYRYEGQESEKNTYSVGYDSKKRRIRTPKRWSNDPNLKQPDGFRKGLSSRYIEICRLYGGSYAQEVKNMSIKSQNQVNKREALGKIQRNLEINRQQAAWKPENNPNSVHLGQIKPDLTEGKKTKQEKIQKAEARMVRQFLATLNQSQRKIKGKADNTTPGSPKSLQKSNQQIVDSAFPWLNRPPPHSDPSEGKAAKVPELHPLLKCNHLSHKTNLKRKTSKVGAKFTWNFRNKLKAKAMPKPRMSMSFYEVLTGKEVKIPELNPAHKIIEKRKTEKEENKQRKSAGMASPGAHKTKQIKGPEPNYGLRTTGGTYRHKHSDGIKSQILHRREATMPKLNVPLMSHHEIFPKKKSQLKSSTESDDLYEFTTPSSSLKPKDSHAHDQMWQDGDLQSLRSKENSPDFDELPSVSSRRSRRLSLPGQKLELKNFYHYIKDSAPDRRIVELIGLKRSLAYMGKNRSSSLWSGKSGRTRLSLDMPENSGRTRPSVEVPENSARTRGSIISTTDIDRFMLAVRPKEAMEVERKDEDDFMFDTVPEDYQPQHNQDPKMKKTLSELIASIAKAEKAKKKSQPRPDKHRPKANETHTEPEGEARRRSILSLKSVRDEIKDFESQALKEEREREQYHDNFLVEKKAAVQARIQELMKYVAIREDFRPPKQTRDFVTENILRLQKKRPQNRSAEVKENRKSNKKYPRTVENLQMHKFPVPNFIQKTKAQKLQRTERGGNRVGEENKLCRGTAKFCDIR